MLFLWTDDAPDAGFPQVVHQSPVNDARNTCPWQHPLTLRSRIVSLNRREIE
jgi:hypothetical protein